MVWYHKREKIPAGLLTKLTQEQKELREKIILQPLKKPINFIAGCDSAFNGAMITSVFVIFSYPDLIEFEVSHHTSRVSLPYIPGFLAFREIPNLLLAYEKLIIKPDLIMVDGQGIMHPRRMGIGAHLGVVLNKPTIGVAKSKLTGEFIGPGENKGDYTVVHASRNKLQKGHPGLDPGSIQITESLGYCLRSKDNVKPLFISPGHLCDMKDTLKITIDTLRKHKLPEPTRIADKYSKELK